MTPSQCDVEEMRVYSADRPTVLQSSFLLRALKYAPKMWAGFCVDATYFRAKGLLYC